MCVPHTPLTHTHKCPLPHLYPWSNSSQREKAVRKSGSNLQYNTGCHTPRWWLMAYILWPREERRAESELQMGVLNSLRSTATCVEKTKHPPEFAQLGSWQCYAITPLKDESQVFLESKTVKFWGVFLLPGKLNKLDSWGLLGFTWVPLFLETARSSHFVSHTHIHSESCYWRPAAFGGGNQTRVCFDWMWSLFPGKTLPEADWWLSPRGGLLQENPPCWNSSSSYAGFKKRRVTVMVSARAKYSPSDDEGNVAVHVACVF